METFCDRILVETKYLGANVSCIQTERGSVLVDSPFLPDDAREWKELIGMSTGTDAEFLINTDHHFDHVLGNCFLTERIICHSTAAKGIKFLRDKNQLKQIIKSTFADLPPGIEGEVDTLAIPSPFITFDKSITIDMGNVTIGIEYVGGHSPGTVLVYVPEWKAVFTGDNVEGQFPYFGQSRFYDWKKALQRIMDLDIEVVVPGHGEVAGKEMVNRYLLFFEGLEKEVKGFHAAGMRVEQMAQESEVLHFFPSRGKMEDRHVPSWAETQYGLAAKQILSGQD